MIPSTAVIAEYGEQISAFLRRATSKTEGHADLLAYSASLLADLPSLAFICKESPAYAGVAFYGRFKATKLALIKKQAKDNVKGEAALAAIRGGKALQVAAQAKAAWDYLLKEDPESLWAAIYLNLCVAPVSVRVAKARSENGDGESDDESGGDDDSDNDDEDDDDN